MILYLLAAISLCAAMNNFRTAMVNKSERFLATCATAGFLVLAVFILQHT